MKYLLLFLFIFPSLLMAQVPEKFEVKETGATSLYKINYFIFGEDETRTTESKFQISIQFVPINDFPLRIAYTQISWWDVGKESGPFRETNYNPSIFGAWQCQETRCDLEVGYEHQSNGQPDTPRIDGVIPSRSWERLFIFKNFRMGVIDLSFKVWDAFYLQENENIQDYYGYGEVTFGINLKPFVIRYTNRPSDLGEYEIVEMALDTPINVKLFVQYFAGFGESLIDLPGTYDTFEPERREVVRGGIALNW